jgi:hypothetical protein
MCLDLVARDDYRNFQVCHCHGFRRFIPLIDRELTIDMEIRARDGSTEWQPFRKWIRGCFVGQQRPLEKQPW